MTWACLVDTTRCIGCRGCQVACKGAHGLRAEKTRFFAAGGGYQNPPRFSPNTRTFVSFHELEDESGKPKWVFVKRQCMHCKDLRCAKVCAPGVFRREDSGEVTVQSEACIGCAACMDECPYGVPTIDYWDHDTPHLKKCTFCFERREVELDEVTIDGRRASGERLARHRDRFRTPACVKACSSGALQFGRRDRLLAEARRRIDATPKKYVPYVYGERELGGLGWLYLAAVPFDKLGLPVEFMAPRQFQGIGRRGRGRDGVASLFRGLGTLAAGVCWFFGRRDDVRSAGEDQ